MESLSVHLIGELFNCNNSYIDDFDKVENVMIEAVKISKSTLVNSFFHKFSPYGVTGVIIIAESHFTIHTWPEYYYTAIDIFTCGNVDYKPAMEYIKNEFEAERYSIFQFKRGIISEIYQKTKRLALGGGL